MCPPLALQYALLFCYAFAWIWKTDSGCLIRFQRFKVLNAMNSYSAAVTVRRHVLSSLSRKTMAGLATIAGTATTGASSAAEQNRAGNITQELYEVLFSDDGALLRDAAFGFSTRSLDHAADQLGLSRACSAAIKPAALVHEFNARKLVELGERLEDVGPPGTMHEGLCLGIRERLLLLEPYRATWAGALVRTDYPVVD